MPRYTLNTLRELTLCYVEFRHEPTELTNLPCLTSLVLRFVVGIPGSMYMKLTCKLTQPNLEKIYIYTYEVRGLNAAVRIFGCRCSKPCLFNLTWLD